MASLSIFPGFPGPDRLGSAKARATRAAAFRAAVVAALLALAACSGGSSSSSSTPATAPSAPTVLTATPGSGSVSLSWTASTGATGYNVYRGGSGLTLANGNKLNGTTPVAVTHYTDSTAINGTPYDYLVTAVNAAGESGASNVASATPQAVTYTIGGTLTGLAAGKTVELQNNGGDDLHLNANGTFTFSTPIADSAAYAVAVLSPPATQTCSVGAGSGTVAAANVTTVTVTCATNTYSIGGQITGLTAGGLVLLDNGGDSLTKAIGSTAFTFATKIADGSPYAVTVGTAPPGRDCNVTGGSGTVTGADVTTVAVACTPNASASTWATLAPMTTARYGLSSAVVNGMIYAIAGATCSNCNTLAVERYDPNANTWATMAPLTFDRRFPVVAAVNGLIYVIGGFSDSRGGLIQDNEAYDPVANTWTTKASVPVAGVYGWGQAVNGKIYVAQSSTQGTVFVYDPVLGSWTQTGGTWAAAPATLLQFVATAVVNNVLYMLGGNDGSPSYFANVYAYDTVANLWSVKAPMPTIRGAPMANSIDGRIYVSGGLLNGSTSLATVDVYDPVTDTWDTTVRPTMPTARQAGTAAVVNGKLYVIGGGSDANASTVYQVNEAYTP